MPADLHERVTATILQQLDTADPATWTPPWHGADPLPRNALTGKRYRGLNILALWCAAQADGYTDARWATYRQWAALGAQVRRGERGTLILFYKDLPTGARTDTTHGTSADSDTTTARFVARASTVFNIAQVDAAPQATAPTGLPPTPQPTYDTFVTATGAIIHTGGTRACYTPATDTIRMPPRNAFRTPEGYAGTLAHELVHWTGAPHRLARDLTGRFKRRAYAAEELIAELGAAFVLADLGLARTPHPDHAAYLASWLPLLTANSRALATAAAAGSRAADYLTALQTQVEPISSTAASRDERGPTEFKSTTAGPPGSTPSGAGVDMYVSVA
ncbi:antirestriction protein ArdC [Methylobacterium sp. Leaf399]|uniref:ArdC family protein n=1 Tax=unclassified Methylobacterium TaxID=2615210 RepID=UPI0006FE4D9A|nr:MULTISPECIES: zincin-like metallopeptidase domain-containing protein [unclassified Methylobacterium]KQP48883.1 antirestriction protein ArdC [Methylobacterium sp. Leaf108]KQT16577.1 antirestriction protein ArdC [Methylobacterium sp. Leaf399]KQT86639.1 antirestriction protein ArdC [Methylobacterium sp. Leaf466]